MLYLIRVFAAATLIHATSCSNDQGSGKPLDYELIKVEYRTENCEPERDACLMVDLSYAKFIEGDSLAQYLANRIIRNSTLDFLGMGDVEAAVTPPIEEAVKDLDESFLKLKQELGTSAGWMAELYTSEVYRNDTLLVLKTYSMTYFGGAHGNYNTRYLNFDRRSGRLHPLTDFVEMNPFKEAAQMAFNEKYVGEGQTYTEAGFDFFDGKFRLPANYGFKGDSMLLHYNHYEIAPYAAGTFDVAVAINW